MEGGLTRNQGTHGRWDKYQLPVQNLGLDFAASGRLDILSVYSLYLRFIREEFTQFPSFLLENGDSTEYTLVGYYVEFHCACPCVEPHAVRLPVDAAEVLPF